MILVIFVSDLARALPWLHQLFGWIQNNARITTYILVGMLFGVIAAIAQSWLIRQRYGFLPRYWRIVTIIGWAVAGISFVPLFWYRYDAWKPLYFIAWFAIPVIFQTFPLWPHVRGAWLWALAGVAAGFISIGAYYTYAWTNQELYALIFGTLAQSLLPAVVLIVLMARQRLHNIRAEAG